SSSLPDAAAQPMQSPSAMATQRLAYAPLTEEPPMKRSVIPTIGVLLLSLLLLAISALQPAAAAPMQRTLCIYDPLGANGMFYQSLESYLIQAREWGIAFEPIPYTQEAVAAGDFKSGKCDAVTMTGIR